MACDAQWQSRRRDRLTIPICADAPRHCGSPARAIDGTPGTRRPVIPGIGAMQIRCARHSGHQSVHHFAHHFGPVQSRRLEAPRLRPRGSICVTSKPSYLLSYGNAMSQLILTCCDRITITLLLDRNRARAGHIFKSPHSPADRNWLSQSRLLSDMNGNRRRSKELVASGLQFGF